MGNLNKPLSDYRTDGVATAQLGSSAHKVQVVLDKRGQRHVLKVAPSTTIERELRGYEMCSRVVGKSFTLEVTGSGPVANDTSYLTTKFLPDLVPFSRRSGLDLPLYGKSRLSGLGRFSRVLAGINYAGISHGDMQIKNFGIRANGLPLIFDLEAHQTNQPLHDTIGEDVLKLLQSLYSKRFGSLGAEALVSIFSNEFIIPYVEYFPPSQQGIVIDATSKTEDMFMEWASSEHLVRA